MRPITPVLLLVLALFACNRVESKPGDASPRLDAVSVAALAAAGLSDWTREAHPEAVIDPERALGHFGRTIEWQSEGWREDLGIEFSTVVVSGTQGTMQDLADHLFHLRRVGAGQPTGGLLLLIDPSRGAAAFTLSYELEGALPDVILSRVARDQLAPYASYSALGMAVMDVYHQLKDYLFVRAAQGELALSQRFRQGKHYDDAEQFLAGGGGAITRLSEIPIDVDLKARVPDAERVRYAPSADPMESVETFLRAQKDMIGDPTLELFTPGSQIMRERYPFAPYEALQRRLAVEASRPLVIVREGDRAVALADRPVQTFAPILLHRIDGLWRIDLVETWKNLFFTSDGSWAESNSNNPYHFALRRFGPGDHHDIAAWDIGENDLHALLGSLEASDDALHQLLAGELLYRNCWVFVNALDRYERAIELAPHAPALHETLGRRADHLGFAELAVQGYGGAGPHLAVEHARALARAERFEDAVRVLEAALDANPFDAYAVQVLEDLVDDRDPRRAKKLQRRIEAIYDDPQKKHRGVRLSFDPPRPVLVTTKTTTSHGRRLHDHTDFTLTVTNRSARAIEVDSFTVSARGTGGRSDLGDLLQQLTPRSGRLVLPPGESTTFSKLWGFEEDTAHTQLSYVFEYCWTGTDGAGRQCAADRVDAYPN